jgi:hypothetical protein
MRELFEELSIEDLQVKEDINCQSQAKVRCF